MRVQRARMASVVAALVLAGWPWAARADERLQAATKQQTLVVQSMIDDRKAEIGSGVVVAGDGGVLTVATAAHVVRDGSPLRILDASRSSYYDVIDVRRIPAHDLALIRVRAREEAPIAPVAFAEAKRGEPVWVWGNPGDSFWKLSTGRVTDVDVRVPGEDGARIAISCETCSFGDSGSGVFNSNGELIGILTAAWSKPGGPVLFIEVQPVSAFADSVRAKAPFVSSSGCGPGSALTAIGRSCIMLLQNRKP